jgi:hypothetical protein
VVEAPTVLNQQILGALDSQSRKQAEGNPMVPEAGTIHLITEEGAVTARAWLLRNGK